VIRFSRFGKNFWADSLEGTGSFCFLMSIADETVTVELFRITLASGYSKPKTSPVKRNPPQRISKKTHRVLSDFFMMPFKEDR
jgi:hypothetical protein